MHSRFELISDTAGPAVDLVTLDALKLELGITGTSEDAAMQARITRESKLIAEWCDRIFGLAQAVETFTFDRGEFRNCALCHGFVSLQRHGLAICLRLFPVTGVLSISLNGTDLDSDDYEIDLERGILWIDSLVSGCGALNTLVVTYTGGYDLPDEAPALLQSACIRSVQLRTISSSANSSVSRVRHGDDDVSFFQQASSKSGLFDDVMAMISPFRSPVLA